MMFIKTYSGVVANATKTLKNTVKVNELISKLNDEYLTSQLKEYKKYNEINLWDLGKRATTQINVGANLAISCKNNIYIGQIIGVIDDVNGAIGDVVGWTRQFGRPWSNVILLKDVVAIPQEERISNFIREHDTYPFKVLNNFIKLENDDEKQFFKIIKNLPIPSKIENPSQLKDIVNDIKKLKVDSTHQEKAHESLTERFFEYLDYEKIIKIKNSESIEELINGLANEYEDVRDAAAIRLAELKDQRAIDYLSKCLLKDPSARVRKNCAMALGEIGGSRAISALSEASNDSDTAVKQCALKYLQNIGGECVIDSISRFLRDDEPNIKFSAVLAIKSIGEASSIDVLQRFLTYENDPSLRKLATDCINEIKRQI